jgi:hypothetical protein
MTIQMSNTGPSLTDARIRDFECTIGNSLPPEFRAFLLRFNCGQPTPSVIDIGELPGAASDAIGDLYFMAGKFEKSFGAFEDAVRCPGGLGNAFIHLRLGECCFELGQPDRAADELTRAYMGSVERFLRRKISNIFNSSKRELSWPRAKMPYKVAL